VIVIRTRERFNDGFFSAQRPQIFLSLFHSTKPDIYSRTFARIDEVYRNQRGAFSYYLSKPNQKIITAQAKNRNTPPYPIGVNPQSNNDSVGTRRLPVIGFNMEACRTLRCLISLSNTKNPESS